MTNIIFWIFMFLCMLLIPAVMIIFGKMFLKSAPKDINILFGYRTERSMKNRDTWIFAHKCIGSLWKNWGTVLLLTVIPLFFVMGKDPETVGLFCLPLMGAQLIVMLVPIFIVESRLKKTFDKYGRRITRE